MGRQKAVDKTEAQDTELSQLYREGAKPKARSERFNLAVSHRNLWSYFAAPGATLEPHLEPQYWTPLAQRLRPLDRIELTEELGAWTATLLVKSIGNDVEVVLISYTVIGGISAIGSKPAFAPGYRISFGGVHSQWAVHKGKALIIDGLPNEKAAETWLQEHVAQQNRRAAS